MSLNPFSETFDAQAALSASNESFLAALPKTRDRVIYKKAVPVNNLAACASLSTAPFRVLRRPAARAEVVKRTSEAEKKTQGVLKELHKRAGRGPLAMLLKAVEDRFRIRVVLRERHAVSGFVDGFLVAFDKHFNLVLSHATFTGERHRRVGQIFVRGENVVLRLSFALKKR